MQLTNEWIEQGKIEGKIEGDLAGRRAMVLRLLHRRFGAVASEIAAEIERLNSSQVDELGDAIFDFHEAADVQTWLAAHP